MQEAVVMIDRKSGVVSVRVKRRRKVWRVMLGDLVSMGVKALLRAEVHAKREAKRVRRKA
jgi:hypothetical protein